MSKLNAFVLGLIFLLAEGCATPAPLFTGTQGTVDSDLMLLKPEPDPTITIHPDATVTPAPLSAIAVSQCGLAMALFIQLDATHLLRADPHQSDLFIAIDGKMTQVTAGPIEWNDAYKIASAAVLTTHVTLPCTDGPQI